MRKTISTMLTLLVRNIKTLILFETLYRFLGVFFILPIVTFLFQLSISLSGRTYITNEALLGYITSPMTILLFMVLALIIAIYVLFELFGLFELYQASLKDENITLTQLVRRAITKGISVLKTHPVILITRAFIFIVVVESIQLLGFIQTQNLPVFFEQAASIKVIYQGIWIISILMFILFIETFFIIPALGFNASLKTARQLLRKQRIKIGLSVLSINLLISIVILMTNAFILFSIGVFVGITKGEVYITSTVLSLFYVLYSFITFLSTLVIIPVNFSYVVAKYHTVGGYELTTNLDIKQAFKISNRWVKRGIGLVMLLFLVFNIQTFIHLLNQDRSQIELFNRPMVIAHRGASGDAPENTIAALELALFQNSDAIEIDIRLSSDDVPVLFHDKTINRTTSGSGTRIESLTLQEIKQLDAGLWFSNDYRYEEIPTLYEALAYLKGSTTVYIELKSLSQTLEDKTIDIIYELDMVDEVVIQSFNQTQLKNIKAKSNGDLKTLLLMPLFYGNINQIFNDDAFDYYGFSVSMVKSNPQYIDQAHELGKRIYVWTVNDVESMRIVSNYDVDGIITDYPLKALDVVYSDYKFNLMDELLRLFNPK